VIGDLGGTLGCSSSQAGIIWIKQFFFLKENPLFVVVEDQSFKTQYPQIGHIFQTFSIFNGDT